MKKLILLLNIIIVLSFWVGCSSSDEAQNSDGSAVADSTSKVELSDSAYAALQENITVADKTVNEADSILKVMNRNITKTDAMLTQADSLRKEAEVAIAQKEIEKAKGLISRADSILAVSDQRIKRTDQNSEKTKSLKDKLAIVQIKANSVLGNADTSAEHVSRIAKRRLIIPGEAWDFDKAPEITTDTRVSPVKFYTDKNPVNSDDFRTVAKDSLIFGFRMYRDWQNSEKLVGNVISYNSPDSKIIITMNSSKSQVDSLKYWASIYEASAYGKNQLPQSEQSFPSDKMESLGGATQSYIARYHFQSTEIVTVFLQKGQDIIASFVEYPNGSLSSSEAEIINQFLNTIKFK